MQGRGECPALQREQHLHDPGDARRRLSVADVGLEGAQQQRLCPVPPIGAVGGEQRLRLDGVAECGSGAVRLDGVHIGGGELRVLQRRADDAPLGGPVGRGQAVGRAILIGRGATHDAEDPVPEPSGVGQALDEQHADALPPAGAVGRSREGLASPVGGQPTLPGELGERGGAGHDGRAAGDGQVALARAQCLDREVQRDQ